MTANLSLKIHVDSSHVDGISTTLTLQDRYLYLSNEWLENRTQHDSYFDFDNILFFRRIIDI